MTTLEDKAANCWHRVMPKPNRQSPPGDIAAGVFSDMPNHVANEAELLAALALGDADIEAGQAVPFEEVAAELRRNYGQA